MKNLQWFILAIAVMGVYACQSPGEFEKKETAMGEITQQMIRGEEADQVGFAGDSSVQERTRDKKEKQPLSEPVAKPDWDKKIIKTAILNLEVKDYPAFYRSLREKVRSAGGYVAQEEQSQSDYKIENAVIIKVPVDQFDEVVNQPGAGIEKINEKKINSQDVTGEMFDTKARMEAKSQVRLRYLDLLRQAKNMQEILNVQNEINSIQEEIESATGRIQYLGHSSTFSTIHLTFYQVLNLAAKDEKKAGFGRQLSEAFGEGWSWIRELSIGIVGIWPLVMLGFVALFAFRKIRFQKPKQA